jgi:hypothetical protein
VPCVPFSSTLGIEAERWPFKRWPCVLARNIYCTHIYIYVMCFIWHTMCICVTSHAICVTCNVYNWLYLCIYIYVYVSAVAYMRSYTNTYVADWFGMPSSIAMSLPAGKWENHWGMFNWLVWWPEGISVYWPEGRKR